MHFFMLAYLKRTEYMDFVCSYSFFNNKHYNVTGDYFKVTRRLLTRDCPRTLPLFVMIVRGR